MPIVQASSDSLIKFSPDGRSVIFADRGPGPAGEDAAQIVTLDIATGTRTPVTRLPATAPDPSNPVLPAVAYASFRDDETIVFPSRANPADPTVLVTTSEARRASDQPACGGPRAYCPTHQRYAMSAGLRYLCYQERIPLPLCVRSELFVAPVGGCAGYSSNADPCR